jgi:isovaleryl-CoA dehydrogenase
MQLEWTAAQAEYRARFRAIAQAVIAPGASERDASATFDRGLWKRLAREGFWRLRVPPQYGGTGGSLWDFLAAFEGLAAGAGDHGFVLSAIAHAGLLQVLLEHGTEEQQARWIPMLVEGGIGATAATEASGGSQVTAIRTAARATADGYILTGEKQHITNAPVADLALIVGRIPALGARDITLFVVRRGGAGVRFGPPEDLLGQRSSPTGSIVLAEASVRSADVVGPPGGGLETLYSFLAFDRLMYGLAVAGFLEPLLHVALERADGRIAFGAPLIEHEYIQDKLVDMKLTMETSRWLAYSAAAALARGDATCSAQASLAKLVAAEGMVRAGLELIQIFGHHGYERAGGVERALRDAVALRMAGGTSEMQKKNVIKHLTLTREHPARVMRTSSHATDGEGVEA